MSALAAGERPPVAAAPPALPTRHPLAAGLPGLFREQEVDPATGLLRDSFAERFTGALDQVLAPVFAALDSFPAYLDPALAPPDFVDWLAGWVAVGLPETAPVATRRDLVARALQLHALRGTARGLAEHVEALTGVRPEVEESGGVSWSILPGSRLPGAPVPRVTVRMAPASGQQIDVRALRDQVAALVPAHVEASVLVVAP